MKKIIGILIVSFILTGCSNVSYDLDIYLNSFEESLYFEYGYGDELDNLDTLIQNNIDNIPSLKNEKIDYDITSSTVEITHTFNNIFLMQNNDILKMLYNNVAVSKNGNITTVKLQGYNNSKFVCGEFDEGCFLTLDKITFTLSSEYQILSSNADIVNVNKNQRIWIFDAQNRDEVYFSYSDEIRWDIVVKNFIETHATLFVIGGIVLAISIIGLIFVSIFIKKSRENNS